MITGSIFLWYSTLMKWFNMHLKITFFLKNMITNINICVTFHFSELVQNASWNHIVMKIYEQNFNNYVTSISIKWFNMFLKITFLWETMITNSIFVWLFVSMSWFNMFLKITLLWKALITISTFVCFSILMIRFNLFQKIVLSFDSAQWIPWLGSKWLRWYIFAWKCQSCPYP